MSTNSFHSDRVMAAGNGRKIVMAIFIIICGLISCKPASTSCPPCQDPDAGQISAVKDSVGQLAAEIALTVSKEGPAAWLRYFYDSPQFFMASDGQLVFPDQRAASEFINNVLVRQIRQINLKWTHLRIDPLTPGMALMASDFHEDITDSTGKTTPTDGYFTAIAQQTPRGWQLRDAHWSIRAGKQ